jgi:hydrogenase/urease accessory protein HupE
MKLIPLQKLILFMCMAIVSFLSTVKYSNGHEIRPALLEINENEPGLFDIKWKIPAIGDRILPLEPVFPQFMIPVGPPSEHLAPGAFLRYFTLKTEGKSIAGETITIKGLSAVQIDVLINIRLADGTKRSTIVRPKSPSYQIPVRETKGAVVWSYTQMGLIHIFEGIDHLLFVLALVIIVPNRWMLLKTITAFTVAHSITLALATLGFVKVPPAPTEAIIALSIVFLAVEIIHSRQGKISLAEKYPWVVAMFFGLFHGLGFAGALSEVGLPQHEIPLALLMFNVGVELGQITFVVLVLCALALFKYACNKIPAIELVRRWQFVPYAIGCVATYWTIERIMSFIA